LRHLQDATEMYDQLSQRANWKVIECFDSAAHAMRTPEQISRDILAATQLVLPSLQEKR